MNSKTALVIALCVLGAALVLAQARGPAPPPADTVAPEIPDVVKGGTKVQDDKISTYIEDTKRTVGLGYDSKGRLLGAAQEGHVLVLAPARAVLADSFGGQRL